MDWLKNPNNNICVIEGCNNEQPLPRELQGFKGKIYRFPRDFAMEESVIKASRIEKQLRDNSFSPAIQETISGTWNGHSFISSNGNFRIVPAEPYHPFWFEQDVSSLFDRQPGAEPQIWGSSYDIKANLFRLQRPLNGLPPYATPFLYLRLSYLSNWQGSFPAILPGNSFCWEDQQAVNYLGEHLQLDGQWYTDKKSSGPFRRSFIDYNGSFDRNAIVIPVKSTDDVLLFYLELLPYYWSCLLLPIAYFQYPRFNQPLRLYLPPPGEVPLFGMEKLARQPELPVILSEEIALALLKDYNPNALFLSTLGGADALGYTDFKPLRGRQVYWLINDWSESADPAEKYKTACKVAQLLEMHQINVQFFKLSLSAWTSSFDTNMCGLQGADIRSAQLLSKEGMWREAESHGVEVVKPQLVDSPEMFDAKALEDEYRMPYLIDPVIRESSSTVIFGATGVAKSWIALALGCAVAYGKSVFASRWAPACRNGEKILILAGEMDKGEYGERIRRLNTHYRPTEHQKGNLLLHIVDGSVDLAAEDGINQIQKIVSHAEKSQGEAGAPVKMVILDNLTTLSTEGENPANFGRIEQVLKSLKSQGIAVIMIHHENNQGDIRGARKIGDVMTSKFHLFKGDTEGDCIGVIIKNEKNRSNNPADMDTFKVILDFENPSDGFCEAPLTESDIKRIKQKDEENGSDDDAEDTQPSRPRKNRYNQPAWIAMSHEERVAAIRAGFRRGDSNEQIAANHSTGRTTIYDFRKEYWLRNQDLQKE